MFYIIEDFWKKKKKKTDTQIKRVEIFLGYVNIKSLIKSKSCDMVYLIWPFFVIYLSKLIL